MKKILALYLLASAAACGDSTPSTPNCPAAGTRSNNACEAPANGGGNRCFDFTETLPLASMQTFCNTYSGTLRQGQTCARLGYVLVNEGARLENVCTAVSVPGDASAPRDATSD